MLLRSVTKHIKDQNWFAVWVDFIIVVVGVFVGIQVANWNDSQKEQQRASEYLARIKVELVANQEDMTRRIEYFTKARNHGISVLEKLNQSAELLDENFLIDAYQASQSLPRKIARATYDELLSVGAINAIGNEAIRKRLAQYYRSSQTSENILLILPSYQNRLRSSMPYKVQTQFRNGNCSNTFKTDESGAPLIVPNKACDLELTEEQRLHAVKEILSADLKSDLTRLLSDHDVKIQLSAVVYDRAQELYDFLEKNE